MELFQTDDYFIFHKGEHSLWCSRKSGQLDLRTAWDLPKADDPVCLGRVHGIIGKLNALPGSEPKLLLIESCSLVGYIWDQQPVYQINKIGILNLGPQEPDIDARPCPLHNRSVAFNQSPEPPPLSSKQQHKVALTKTWGSIKSATKNLKSSTLQAAQRIGKEGGSKEVDRIERRIWDEVEKMFFQTESFYFSPTVDLTNSFQNPQDKAVPPSWRTTNNRFFWNKFLLKELIDLEDPKADPWILPILHGYIHINKVAVEWDGIPDVERSLTLLLISRRSRHRAGTRYKKRGVDDQGYVANYVETEQCLLMASHVFSFVQVRGSVPVYWSQPGFKYRPPPQLDKGAEETREAVRRHFERELSIYQQQCIVSLVEQNGKEKVIGDAYLEHIRLLNEPRLVYVTFDFHEQCRGMRFENVARLVNGLEDILRDMRYSWIDSHGVICQQQITFRVNCIDCLDRTNIVQTAFAKYMLEVQLNKLGILPPEGTFWPALKSAFNVMWANNGDVLSRQYAGTNALKGDFTRTGERRFAGMMKDGMNSASRYYVNRFKDNLKQVAIDLMLGQVMPEEALSVLVGGQKDEANEDGEDVILQTADRVRQVIDDCRKQFVTDEEIVVGSWGLVDAHPLTSDPDPTQNDMDTILILTRESLYVVSYDDHSDRVTGCRKCVLCDLMRLEVGVEKGSALSAHSGVNFFKNAASPKRGSDRSNSAPPLCVMRVHLATGDALQFRSTKLRFFNNMAVPICKTEDMNESLKAIAETIHITMDISGLTIPYTLGQPLDKFPKTPSSAGKTKHLDIPLLGFPRNASEGQLSAIKEAGNKALSSVTSHFARFKSSGSSSRSPSARQSVKVVEVPSSVDPSDHQSVERFDSDLESNASSSLEDLHSAGREVRLELYSHWAGILFLTSRNQPTVSPKDPFLETETSGTQKPKILLRCISAGNFYGNRSKCSKDTNKLTVVNENSGRAVTPEILISCSDRTPVNLRRSKHLSHSSESVEPAAESKTGDLARASSVNNLPSNPSESSAEGAASQSLGSQLLTSLKIPLGHGKPMSILAKGVQQFGANLDPRKILQEVSPKKEPLKPRKNDSADPNCLTRILHL